MLVCYGFSMVTVNY